MPLPVEQADTVAVEHVQHVRVVSAGDARRRPRRRRRRRAHVHHRRPAEELHDDGGDRTPRAAAVEKSVLGAFLKGTPIFLVSPLKNLVKIINLPSNFLDTNALIFDLHSISVRG